MGPSRTVSDSRNPFRSIVAERLGYGEEKSSYAATYRHGKTLCKRNDPDCDACPLTRRYRFFARER